MKNLFKITVIVILLSLCGCTSGDGGNTDNVSEMNNSEEVVNSNVSKKNDAGENASASDSSRTEQESNEISFPKEYESLFSKYNKDDTRIADFMWDAPGQVVLTVEEAKESVLKTGYFDAKWCDLWGNPFGGDNTMKNIIFVIQTGKDETYENYSIGYELDGDIVCDWIGKDNSVNNGCWQFTSGYDGFFFVEEDEVANFENWAIESGNYDYYYYTGTEIDKVDYKIEASANRNAYDYRDLLRNPDNYLGLTTCIKGKVSWVGDYNFIFTTYGGDTYIVYGGEDAPNLLAEDSCTIFGEFYGTEEYYTTNIYGTTTTHTAVCLYAPYIVTGNASGIPCDYREIDLIYTTFARAGGGGDVSIDYDTIGYPGSDNRKEYKMTYGDKEIVWGTEQIPIAIEYYIPSEDITVYAEGYFFPWSRQISWHKVNSWLFYFDETITYSESWAE